ncbi:response regulator [Cyanobium sp. HWJ4-Hawea]|uniref:response regulator n=1 Tax=unclassified Cyanobium TaxID=2627006 RepID=UPI0020CE4C1D|nr:MULTISPECIES: response regulator [unclassified Cyanobium]MCP9774332.1 response regulator [Cyanobium sp. WAJ14-Wanaka]MCP9809186.1 response regulator [Cyanobium sp. HWJ4-Hawea]
MAKPFKVWLVDDDPELRQMLGSYLSDHGYEVRCFETAELFLVRLAIQRPDLVVLDVMLPGQDGLSLMRQLRGAQDDLPVVMLTAKGDPVDRIIGLEQGADDYLAKPFLPRELTARVDSVLRRHSQRPVGVPLEGEEPVVFGQCVLNLHTRTLQKGDCILAITTGEFSLLMAFVQNAHRPLSRQRLIDIARGPASETDLRSMDVQVSRLRKLIEADPRRPRYIQTVWGFGYVFVPEGKPAAC